MSVASVSLWISALLVVLITDHCCGQCPFDTPKVITLTTPSSSGVIKSPGYPYLSYEVYKDCAWQIITTSNNNIRIDVVDVQLQSSEPYCYPESMVLYDGDYRYQTPSNASVVARLCNTNTRKTYYSTQPSLYVHLRTRGYGETFFLQYNVVPGDPPTTTASTSSGGLSKTVTIVLIVLGSVTAVVIGILILLLYLVRRKARRSTCNGGPQDAPHVLQSQQQERLQPQQPPQTSAQPRQTSAQPQLQTPTQQQLQSSAPPPSPQLPVTPIVPSAPPADLVFDDELDALPSDLSQWMIEYYRLGDLDLPQEVSDQPVSAGNPTESHPSGNPDQNLQPDSSDQRDLPEGPNSDDPPERSPRHCHPADSPTYQNWNPQQGYDNMGADLSFETQAITDDSCSAPPAPSTGCEG